MLGERGDRRPGLNKYKDMCVCAHKKMVRGPRTVMPMGAVGVALGLPKMAS